MVNRSVLSTYKQTHHHQLDSIPEQSSLERKEKEAISSKEKILPIKNSSDTRYQWDQEKTRKENKTMATSNSDTCCKLHDAPSLDKSDYSLNHHHQQHHHNHHHHHHEQQRHRQQVVGKRYVGITDPDLISSSSSTTTTIHPIGGFVYEPSQQQNAENMYITRVSLNSPNQIEHHEHHQQQHQTTNTDANPRSFERKNFSTPYINTSDSSSRGGLSCWSQQQDDVICCWKCNNYANDNNCSKKAPLPTSGGRCSMNDREMFPGIHAQRLPKLRSSSSGSSSSNKNYPLVTSNKTTRQRSTTTTGSSLSCCSCCCSVAVQGAGVIGSSSSISESSTTTTTTAGATTTSTTTNQLNQQAANTDSADVKSTGQLNNQLGDSNRRILEENFRPSNNQLDHETDYSLSSFKEYFSSLGQEKPPAFVKLLEEQREQQKQKHQSTISEAEPKLLVGSKADKEDLLSASSLSSPTVSELKRKIAEYESRSSGSGGGSLTSNNSNTNSVVNSESSLTNINKIISNQLEFSGPPSSQAAKTNASNNDNGWNHLDWRNVARRYSDMPRQHRGRFWWSMRQSCFCHVIFSTLNTLFPILSSFHNYSLPGDLITDLLAGFTLAVMHIPQGMAYGMLSGVDPIYGLYVSFVPVIVMAFMSKSYHVSYGTFAVISMLLVNSIESTKHALNQQQLQTVSNLIVAANKNASELLANSVSGELGALILTDNHQANDPTKQLLRNLLIPQDNQQQQQAFATSTMENMNNNNNINGFPYESNLTSSRGIMSAGGDSNFVMPTNIEILTSVCLITGIIQIILGAAKLGILSLMFSDQLVSGFTTASAINVVTFQLSNLFDFKLPDVPEGLFKIFRIWWAFGWRLTEGFNQYTAMLSLFSFIFLISIKELVEPAIKRRFKSITCLPTELALMSLLIVASWYWKFESVYGIHIVGHIPTGLPTPTVPRLDLTPFVIEDAFTVALVSFAMNFSLATVYARKFKYKLDPNQELIAVGTSNTVASFFSCFPCASSLSRSAIQSSLNVKSQICSLFSCLIVLLIVCYFAPVLHDLPRASLSCIIIVALKGILVQIKDLYLNWCLSKLDALVWLITFFSVFIFGITYGLVVGIIASLFMIFFRLLTPNHSILGQLPNTEIYVDTDAFIDCQEVDQVKIYRFNSALCYLNRTMFKSSVEKSLPEIFSKRQGLAIFCSQKKSKHMESNWRKIKYLIIDCSALAYCDYAGAATLVDIVEELDKHDLTVFLVACPLKLINMLEKMKSVTILERNVYPTITDAINYIRYLKRRNSKTTISDSTLNDCYALSTAGG